MPVLNAKGKPFSASYTAITDYEGCPSRYAHARFYCDSPFQDSEALRWGNRVHKAAEMFIKAVPHRDDEALEPVEAYATAMIRSGNRLEAEYEIALDRSLKRVSWFSKDAWLRAKIDVILTKVSDKEAVLYDWKTGKIKDDDDQLRLNIAMLSHLRPEIKKFGGKYIWTKFKQITGIKPVPKADVPAIWQDFLPRIRRMEDAWATENFPAKPSGLCPYCPVKDCPQRRG